MCRLWKTVYSVVLYKEANLREEDEQEELVDVCQIVRTLIANFGLPLFLVSFLLFADLSFL